MEHLPRGLSRNVQFFGQLKAGHTLPRGHGQVGREQLLAQAHLGVLQGRVGQRVEVAPAVAAPVFANNFLLRSYATRATALDLDGRVALTDSLEVTYGGLIAGIHVDQLQ